MLFGFSIGDIISLTTLAKEVVCNIRNACGDYDQLTEEVSGLYINLELLEREISKPDSIFHRIDSDDNGRGGTPKDKLGLSNGKVLLRNCEDLLNKIVVVLKNYDQLPKEERSFKKAWQMVRFGNGKYRT